MADALAFRNQVKAVVEDAIMHRMPEPVRTLMMVAGILINRLALDCVS